MDTRPEREALRGTVDLVRTPYVVEILDALHHGRQPVPATSAPSEHDLLDVAIRYLVDAGVLAALAGCDTQGQAPSQRALSLTDMGCEVAAIVADLCRKP